MMYLEDAKEIFNSLENLGKTSEEIFDFFKAQYSLMSRETFRYILERLEVNRGKTQQLLNEDFGRTAASVCGINIDKGM